jgi:hypothetical protein
MHIAAEETFSGSRKAIRLIMLVDYLIFGLFVIPPAHRWIDRGFLALKSISLEDPVGWSLQGWLLGSTVVATALFGRMAWKKWRAVSAGMVAAPLRFEGILLLAWWLVVLGACAYGFMLGMGG